MFYVLPYIGTTAKIDSESTDIPQTELQFHVLALNFRKQDLRCYSADCVPFNESCYISLAPLRSCFGFEDVQGSRERKQRCGSIVKYPETMTASKPADTEPAFTFIDLFAGIGGMRLGFETIGGNCVFTSEWNQFAQQTYQANFPDAHPLQGDITQIATEAIPAHDVLLAGFPCQPFSLAGVSKKDTLLLQAPADTIPKDRQTCLQPDSISQTL